MEQDGHIHDTLRWDFAVLGDERAVAESGEGGMVVTTPEVRPVVAESGEGGMVLATPET